MEKNFNNSSFHLSHIFRLVFFVVGLSLGISLALYFKTIFFSLHSTISITSLKPPPLVLLPSQPPSLPPLLAPPPPPPPPPEYKPILLHYMDDNELFSQALDAPQRSKGSIPKVAFMFLTKGPMPLGPLWEIFFKGNEKLYTVYVHPHPSYVDSIPEHSVFYRRRIPSKPAEWGKSTMIDAERRLLANALLDPSNERFVLLSETCIPLFNFNTTYNYLINSHKSFLGSFDDPRKCGRGRYNPSMFPKITVSEWRKGSQWFEVSRKVALEIVSDTMYYPLFAELCNAPCYMDEHYMPTLININCPEENSNRSITFVHWPPNAGPHPSNFRRNDVSFDFLNGIRYRNNCTYNGNTTTSLCLLFARKFLPNTLEPLLRLAPLLFNSSVHV